jgi:uncharacterized protein YPO0396
MIKQVRAQFKADMEKMHQDAEEAKAKAESLEQQLAEQAEAFEAKLAATKEKLKLEAQFQLDSAMEKKDAEIEALNAELAEWPEKIKAQSAVQKAALEAEFELAKAAFRVEADNEKTELAKAILEEYRLVNERGQEEMQAKCAQMLSH